MNACINCKHYKPTPIGDDEHLDLCKEFIKAINPIDGFVTYAACHDLRYRDRQVVDCGHYEEKEPWWKIFEKLVRLWKKNIKRKK